MLVALFVAVLILTVVCAFNFLLTLRLSRLMREQPPTDVAQTRDLKVGSAMPEFWAVTTTGVELNAKELDRGVSVFGFLTPSCRPCHESVPDFAKRAKEVTAAGGRVV